MFLFYWLRFGKVLTVVFTVGVVYFFEKYLPVLYSPERSFFDSFLERDNFILSLVVYFAVWSFADYWNHRLYHNRLMWPIHRLHHSADDLTLFTAYRNHPTSSILDPLTKILPMLLLGVPEEMVTAIIYFNAAYQLLVHSNINSDWGWFGNWVLLSPRHHRLHHSASSKHYGKNMGIFSLWDRLFGTYMQPPEKVEAVGVKMKRYDNDHIFKIFYFDVVDFLGNVRSFFFRISLMRTK